MEQVHALEHGSLLVETEPAVFRVEGPGAIACLQGLLTSDLEKPGPDSIVFGAMLTPKGMIVFDCWVLRDETGCTLIVPAEMRPEATELFRRQLPPRLARVTDRTGAWSVLWCLGREAPARLGMVPECAIARALEPGRLAENRSLIAVPSPHAPFRVLVAGEREEVSALRARAAKAGVRTGSPEDLEASRILGGWPAMGAEIGGKTLPQEVRFDEIGGVSYTKGCYVGQETVARVHFRGHPNRELRGVVWTVTEAAESDPDTGEDIVGERDGKVVGQLSSALAIDTRRLGLSVLRREVNPGDVVRIGPRPARVVSLPFSEEEIRG